MKQIMVKASELGCLPYRMNVGTFYDTNGSRISIGIPGTPDIMVLCPNGQTVWIEVKTATGRLRADQERFIAVLHNMNYPAEVCRSVEEAEVFIRQVNGGD